MAFIGTPLDTRNTFQSLVGKRFSGDGSTTAFTLDVAPSSTLDIEVFVGNVRQDPNSAYTLSGTTLTFTGAPPSGTNNIYVVHQAKSVGTITPGANSVGVTELNLSDGSSGQFIKTDGSGTLSFASVASLAGIDDQSSSNDDQLTITDTAVVINEDSDDVDFRVESNGNANMLFVSGGNDVVGVGAEGDLGNALHVKSGDSGASVANEADELVVEASGDSGISILSGTGNTGGINFGDSGDNDIGRLVYDQSGNSMRFIINASERMRIHSGGAISIGSSSVVDPSSDTGGAIALQPGGLSTFLRSGNAALSLQRTTNNGRVLQFYRDTTERGYVEVDGSSTTYATSSDYRLKENIVDLDNGIARLKELKPRRFNFIGESATRDGFVAHEVTAVPEAISGTKDETETKEKLILDKDNNILASDTEEADWIKGKEDGIYPSDSTWVASKVYPVHQGIDQSKLVPLLTAALQEAVTKIETLEAKVKALEEA